MKGPTFFLLAGEPSGDFIGAHLMKALKQKYGKGLRIIGIGGPQMEKEGLQSLVPMKSLSVIGITEIIPQALGLLKKIRETADFIKKEKPDAVITIDLPAFSFRLGKKLKETGIPHIHYGAPTVWAWRPRRARMISKFLTHLLTLFPFEPPYFTKHGLPTTFVGDPVLEAGFDQGHGEAFRKRHNIPKDAVLLCMLPGSRKSEVSQLAPIFADTVRKLQRQFPKLHIVIPTVSNVSHMIGSLTKDITCPSVIITHETEKADAFAASDVALAASGSVALELACAQLPMVITYKASMLTFWIVQRMIKVPYACMINILLNRSVIPEYLQENCEPEKLSRAISTLLTDKALRQKQVQGLKKAKELLKSKEELPSVQAANVIGDIIGGDGKRFLSITRKDVRL